MRLTFSSEKNSAGDVTPALTLANPSIARGIMAEMHDRMPVILRADALDWWLGTAQRTPDELIARSAPANELEGYPVTRAMSTARHKGADSIAPIRINEQPALF